ncbi:MAG: PH domain-containing protein [Candidatus Kapaibacteriales bacterium]
METAQEYNSGSEFGIDQDTVNKLHPLTLLYNSLAFLPQIAIPAYIVIQNGGEGSGFLIFTVVMGILLLPSIYLNYHFFSYTFTDKDIKISSGVLQRKQRSVSYKRIQNVAMKQNILMKYLGLVQVTIETAGDAGTEAELKYVKEVEYENIKSFISNIKSEQEEEERHSLEPGDSQEGEVNGRPEPVVLKEPDLVYKMSLLDTIKFGATRIRPTLLVILAWVYGFLQQFFPEDWIEEYLDESNIDQVSTMIETTDWLTIFLISLGGLVVMLLISWIIDILLAVNGLWDFKLEKKGSKLYSSRGLLNKVKKTIPIKKVQVAKVVTNIIKERFDFYSLDLGTASSPASGKVSSETRVIPLTSFEKGISFLNKIGISVNPPELQNVSKKTIRRAFIRYLVFLGALTVGIYFIADSYVYSLVFLPLAAVVAYLRWKYRLFGISDGKLYIKKGFLVRRFVIVPVDKIQNIILSATFFQRRLGLSSLRVETAAAINTNVSTIVDIDYKTASELRSKLLYDFHILNETTRVFRKPDTKLKLVQEAKVVTGDDANIEFDRTTTENH